MEEIFVFGSNLLGAHGAGAAAYALKHHGARWGVGFGHQGDSFAIPTKDWCIDTLPVSIIAVFVGLFKDYARENPELKFKLTAIGCGLAGLKPAQIGPLFKGATSNVLVPVKFAPYVV
jgi:hypothetical protein